MLTYHSDILLTPQVAEMVRELNLDAEAGDAQLTARRDPSQRGLDIERRGNAITIIYSEPVYLYRALSLLREQGDRDFHITESARFCSNGLMVDCSRNAVPNMETVKKLIRQLARMGMNRLMLYTEDTFEIPEEPYFGYMRGRYTQTELQALDAYAAGFGVELIPCIQTLAHLSAALKWQRYAPISDTGDILLIDEPETYAFIERMLAACRSAFRSRHIHVGMDEAFMVGRGKYYDKHGSVNRFELMNRHLKKVLELCKKHHFEPMIWSDMYFHLANDGNYTGPNPVPAEYAADIPEEVSLVFWDYYHDDVETYDRMIKNHLALPGKTIFAGGAWKWTGYLPLTRSSIERTKTALSACAANGVEDVFITAWGDGGADASLFSVLPVLQCQAELNFYDSVDDEHLGHRLKTCAGAVLEDFMLLDPPDVNLSNKYLLFQDILLGLFDRHIPKDAAKAYKALQEKLQDLKQSSSYDYVFETIATLFGVLALKAELSRDVHEAYINGDRAYLGKAANDILPALITQTKTFRSCMETQWMKENKPFGFEVQDIRIGGLIQRLKTAEKRIGEYINGESDCIPELEETRLPILESELDKAMFFNDWVRSVTASNI